MAAGLESMHPIMQQIEKERGEFSISELASEFDVTPRAIRFYEDHGLLAPKRAGQRRIYSPRDRTRLEAHAARQASRTDACRNPGTDRHVRARARRAAAARALPRGARSAQGDAAAAKGDIEAQLSELQAFEKKIRKQLKQS